MATPSHAEDKEITIAYQQIVDPWVVGIANGSIEKATGYKINWRQFESGAKVATALASGDVKVGVSGRARSRLRSARVSICNCSGFSTTSTRPKRWWCATAPASRTAPT